MRRGKETIQARGDTEGLEIQEGLRESRRASRLDERVESGSIEDFALAQGTPAQQREVRSFLEDRRIVTPADIREARHVSGNTMWNPDVGVMIKADELIRPPLEFDSDLTPRANMLLQHYVYGSKYVHVNNKQAINQLDDVLGKMETEGDWKNYRPVNSKKLFRSLVNDLAINNKSYQNIIKERLTASSIPDKFTVYRGRSKKEPRGYGKWEDDFVASVSTSRPVAATFAPALEDPAVDAYTVNYEDIMAFGAVSEKELIVRLPTQPDSTTRPDDQAEIEAEFEAEKQSEFIPDVGIRESRQALTSTLRPTASSSSIEDALLRENWKTRSTVSKNQVGVVPEIKDLFPLYNVIKDPENAEGFTVRIDGRPIPKRLKNGYVLAPIKSAEHRVKVNNIQLKDVVKFADDIRRVADVTGKEVFAGGWKQGNDYYLDAVSIYDSLEEALYTAEDGEQEAIFHLGEFNEIDTKKGIERLKQTGAYIDKTRNELRRRNSENRFEYAQARNRDRDRPTREYETNLRRYLTVESIRESRSIYGIKELTAGDNEISTIFPTSSKRKLDPAKIFMLSYWSDYLKDSDNKTGRIAKVVNGNIKKYNWLKIPASMKDPKEIMEYAAESIKDNLIYIYDKVPKEIREISRRWYEGANFLASRVAERNGVTLPQTAGVIAAMSPQKDWNQNFSLAERVIDIYTNEANFRWNEEMSDTGNMVFVDGLSMSSADKKKYKTEKERKAVLNRKRAENKAAINRIKDKSLTDLMESESFADAGMWLRIYDQTYNDSGYSILSPDGKILDKAKTLEGADAKIAWGSMSEIGKAIRVLRGNTIDHISSVLGGKGARLEKGRKRSADSVQHKVRNFYNNIVDPNSDSGAVTVDTHAVSAGVMKPLSGSSFEVNHNFGSYSSSSVVDGYNGTYALFEEAYRRAAKERGVLPREMQSVVWDAARTLFTPIYKQEEIKKTPYAETVWDNYSLGKKGLKESRELIYAHAKGLKKPEWYRPDFASVKEYGKTSYDRKLSRQGLPGQVYELGRPERGGAIYDPRLSEAEGIERSRPTVLPAEGIEEVVAQNIREGQEANAGLQPKFSQNASPEAQYVARNPDKATPLSDSMDIRYSRSAATPVHGKYVNKYSATHVPDSHPIMAYIRETEGTWNKIKVAMTAVKQRAINNWARLEAVSQDPRLRDLYGSSSAMAAALMSDRSRGLVASALKYGVPVYKNGVMRVVNDIKGTRTDKQLTGVMDGMVSLFSNSDLTGNPDVNLEKLAQAYAAAKRESSFDPEKGIIVKVTAEEQKEAIEEIQAEVDQYINSKTGKPIVEEWYAWWQDYNENTIQWLQDTGVVNAETAEIWRAHATYYPFYEQAQQNPNVQNHKEMKVFAGMTSSAQFERLKGSKNPLDVPLLEAVTRNLSAAMDMGMKNVAQQRIIRDQVEFGMARNITNQPDKHDRVPVVRFMVDGTEQIYEIDDPLIHESMLAMGQGDLGWVVNNIFGPASQLLRETVTRDPAFVLVNMMRDTMSAYVTSGSNFVPVVDTVKGFFGSDMQELEMLGVVGGYDFSNDPKDVVKFMKRLAAKRGTPIGKINREGELDIGGRIEQGFEAPVLKQFKQLWQGMGAVTTQSDAATRRAVYNDVLARTGDLGEAQIQALEIINFSRRGNSTLMRTLTAAIPFLNARMQGVDVLWRSFTGRYSANKEAQNMHIMRTAMLRGATLMAATSIYYLLVSDEDEYGDARPEVRDDYFIVPLKSIGMDTVLRLPVPFEVGLIFKTIPERILDSMLGDSTSRDVKNTVVRGITSTLEVNPLQAQAFAPIIESWLNHDFYTGRSIVPMYMDQDVASGLQDTFGTRELAVKIGKALNLSPIKIDHIMTGYAGTLGVYGLDVIDAFMRTEGRIKPERRLDQYPVIKRFFASPRGGGLQAQFYELNNQVRGVVTTMNRLKRQGRYDELNAFMKTRQGLVEIRGNVNYVAKEMAEYRRQRSQIQRSNFDPETKREMLEVLEAEINLMLKVAPELKRIANVPAFERTG